MNNKSPYLYSIIEKDSIDNFIVNGLTHFNYTSKEYLFVELLYYISQVVLYNHTQGEILTNISTILSNDKKTNKILKILYFTSKILLKTMSSNNILVRIIYQLIDVISYIYFIGSKNGIGLHFLDFFFRPSYLTDNNHNIIDSFLFKKIILNEISKVILMIMPNKIANNLFSLNEKRNISYLCCYCHMELTNHISLGKEKYCYYCFKKKQKKIESKSSN